MTVWSSQISPIILAVVLPSARVRRETFTRTSFETIYFAACEAFWCKSAGVFHPETLTKDQALNPKKTSLNHHKTLSPARIRL